MVMTILIAITITIGCRMLGCGLDCAEILCLLMLKLS